MDTQAVTDLIPSTGVYLQLASFTLVLVIGLIATRTILVPAVSLLMGRRDARKETRHSVRNLTKAIGAFIAFTVGLQAGNFGSLVTVIGTIGAAFTVALGWGMRDQISNIVAGFFIYMKNPFYVGDYIRTGDAEGVIEDITIRYTTLTGTASQTIHVPNSQLTMEEVENFSKDSKTKGSISISFPTEDVREGVRLLKSVIEEHSAVLETPAPEIMYLDEAGEVTTEVHYWVADPRTAKDIKSDVLETFHKRAVETDLLTRGNGDDGSSEAST